MIINAWGVVIARRNISEADRLVTLYTETLGKLTVRFAGVNKALGKLKGLSEPMVLGEYRLYVSARSDIGKAVGGKMIASFPSIRAHLDRTIDALACCELLAQLTPEHVPSVAKYELICSALDVLERGPSPWLTLAFGLQLLDLAGFGLAGTTAPGATQLWRELHVRPFASLDDLQWDAESASAFRHALYAHVEAQSGRVLKTLAFQNSLRTARQVPVLEALAC